MSGPSIVLLGAKPGGAAALEILLARGWDVRAVVPSDGRATSSWNQPHLRRIAEAAGVPIRRQDDLDEQVDLVVSYMHRHLVRPRTLALARIAALNFHAAPLPRFGGFAFYNVAILEEVTTYGVTCHHMDEGFDSGDLVEVRGFPIDPSTETAVSLERKAQDVMIGLFADVCAAVEDGRDLARTPQDPAEMRYLSREEFDALKRIPNGSDAVTIDRYARAFWYPPYPGARIDVGGVDVEVVPEIAKLDLAELLHESDLDRLRDVVASRAAR